MYNVALLAHRPPPSDLFLALATRAADHVLIYLACGTVVRGRSARSGFLQLHRHVCYFAQGPPFRIPPLCAPFCKLLFTASFRFPTYSDRGPQQPCPLGFLLPSP